MMGLHLINLLNKGVKLWLILYLTQYGETSLLSRLVLIEPLMHYQLWLIQNHKALIIHRITSGKFLMKNTPLN